MAEQIINGIRYINNTRTIPEYSFEFPFERTFVINDAFTWIGRHWSDSFYWCSTYVLIIFGGKHLMKNRAPFKLRGLLFFWNLGLALFSMIGVARFFPEVIHSWRSFGFHWSVCEASFLRDSKITCFWSFAFTLSKLPELGDTLFIVLRKQKLLFLHYYHHVSVFIFSWYCLSRTYSPGRWYIWMNFAVHSLMYSYYAARVANVRLPKSLAMLITLSQIAQMIAGFFVTLYSVLNLENCPDADKRGALSGLLIYGSYFVLFSQFFLNVYFGDGKFAKASKAKQVSFDENNNVQEKPESSKKLK